MGRFSGRWIPGPPPARRARTAPPRPPPWQLAAVVGATVVVDQVSKALAWRGSGKATLNPGSEVVAPWLDATSRSALGGALLDLTGVLVLATAAVLVVRRCRDRLLWWAAALNIAGWSSNLLDRLGLHWLTAPGSRRGTVDWLRGYNLADLAIWAGCALVLAWLAREVLGDLGWDLRQRRHRLVAAVALSLVTGLVLGGTATTDGSLRPGADDAPGTPASRQCRDPAFALAPVNRLLCADQSDAAHPVEVTSAVACRAEEDTAIVHVTLTNPNADRRARFGFVASGPFRTSSGAASHGLVEAGGAIRLRLLVPRRAVPTLLYLETAVEVWEASGAEWVPGTTRVWSTDTCARSAGAERTARVTLQCAPDRAAHVALTLQPLSYGTEHRVVVLSWRSPMTITVDGRTPRGSRLAVDLVDGSLTVVRVTPRSPSDVLVVTGWGPGAIQYADQTARSIRLPVGRCVEPGGVSRARAGSGRSAGR